MSLSLKRMTLFNPFVNSCYRQTQKDPQAHQPHLVNLALTSHLLQPIPLQNIDASPQLLHLACLLSLLLLQHRLQYHPRISNSSPLSPKPMLSQWPVPASHPRFAPAPHLVSASALPPSMLLFLAHLMGTFHDPRSNASLCSNSRLAAPRMMDCSNRMRVY